MSTVPSKAYYEQRETGINKTTPDTMQHAALGENGGPFASFPHGSRFFFLSQTNNNTMTHELLKKHDRHIPLHARWFYA